MTAKTTPGPAKSRANLFADSIAGLTTGVENAFVAATTLRESMRAAFAAAELWLQTPPAEADQATCKLTAGDTLGPGEATSQLK